MIIIVEGGDCASFFARMSVGERGERTNERTNEGAACFSFFLGYSGIGGSSLLRLRCRTSAFSFLLVLSLFFFWFWFLFSVYHPARACVA